MLLVQKFLETKTFQDLIDMHGVYASFNKTGDCMSLNYDMIESRADDLLAQECRGLILAKIDGSSFLNDAILINNKLTYNHICPGDTRIVCFGMKRFFNYGQGSEAPINWNDPNLVIFEKIDGTLCQVYYNPTSNKWNVATRSVPEADLLMDNGLYTFRSLFDKALFDTNGMSFDDFTSKLDKTITYCFELTTPLNKIVVNYIDYSITLIAARSLISLNEIDIRVLPHYNVPLVQAHAYTSISELVEWISTLSPNDHEGVVVRDSKFNRVKIKSAAYCAAHKLNDRLGASERNCMELILSGQEDDMISFLPKEIAENLNKLKMGLQRTISEYDCIFNTIFAECEAISPGDKKLFAITLNKLSNKKIWTAPLFKMYDRKVVSMSDFIQKSKAAGTWSDSLIDKLIELSK